MKAYANSIRIAPKKANLIAKMVRGMPVPDAVESLRRTNKKAARIIEDLLRSAIANASHNFKQDPQMMVVKTLIVNQGQAYRRGMPMARGRMRPYRKFLSHITLELGFAGDKDVIKPKNAKKDDSAASQKPKSRVKTAAKSEKVTSKKTASNSPDSF